MNSITSNTTEILRREKPFTDREFMKESFIKTLEYFFQILKTRIISFRKGELYLFLQKLLNIEQSAADIGFRTLVSYFNSAPEYSTTCNGTKKVVMLSEYRCFVDM